MLSIGLLYCTTKVAVNLVIARDIYNVFGFAIRDFFAPHRIEHSTCSIMLAPYFVGISHITINFETTMTCFIGYCMCSTTFVVPHLVDVKCDPLMVTIVPNLATFAN